MINLPLLRLKKNEDRRILAGHLWIYSNEIDIAKTPLKSFSIGETVRIENAQGKFLGVGYINPHSLICTRLLTRENIAIDKEFFYGRIKLALTLREQIFTEPFYRLLFGESDGLPGVVIDRYGEILTMQIMTAGMEKHLAILAEVLQELLPIKGILLRNDSPIRVMEKLPLSIVALYGHVPDEIIIKENQCEFIVPLWKGQKTGWFFDHRANRAWLQSHAKNKRILDVFSYLGAWAIPMA
jgi:23S rRNA (cytosine1962-C5)-methyltransferase